VDHPCCCGTERLLDNNVASRREPRGCNDVRESSDRMTTVPLSSVPISGH
jgi:hypothetical protein